MSILGSSLTTSSSISSRESLKGSVFAISAGSELPFMDSFHEGSKRVPKIICSRKVTAFRAEALRCACQAMSWLDSPG